MLDVPAPATGRARRRRGIPRLSQAPISEELIDIPVEAAAPEPWFNETLTSVNDAVIRLGVIDGDFRWHKHDD